MPKRKASAGTSAAPRRKSKAEQAKAQAQAEPEPSLSEDPAPEEEVTSSDDGSDSDGFPSADGASAPPSSDDEDGEAFDSIDVDFGFFNPAEGDFLGLKSLLGSYLDGRQYSGSELVEAVIAAPAGSVIKCGEGEEAIGVTAVLPLSSHSKLKSLGELKAFLSDHCPAETKAKLEAAWGAPGAALLISERLLNCPPQLAPPLMESLFEEVAEVVKEKIKQYIFVVRAYQDPSAAPGADLIFGTPEGEFLAKRAAWTFSFPVPNRPVGKDDLAPRRVVAAVPAAAVAAALRDMRAAVPPRELTMRTL